jgi:hypothetical protein
MPRARGNQHELVVRKRLHLDGDVVLFIFFGSGFVHVKMGPKHNTCGQPPDVSTVTPSEVTL